MKRLSGLDASFLYLETPTQLLHVCGLLVLDPDSIPDGYTFASMKERMARQAGAIPEFRQKLRHVPMDLDHPVWVDDEDFDIDRHVHRLALPTPGGPEELTEVTGHLAGLSLDRSRPLWDMWIIEGLADGRIAVFIKMHHATVDGTSGMGLLAHLCALEPEAAPQPPSPDEVGTPPRAPGDLELLARAAVRNSMRPLQVAKLVAPTIGALAGTVDRVRQGTAMAAPLTAPRTSFNATITGRRAIAYADLPLDEVKAIKNAVEGATVNDVVLTLCGGALRRYLEERDELPDTSLLATVPVSVRGTSQAGGVNQVSALFARLGTDIADPGERLTFVSQGNRKAKDHNKAIPAEALQEWAELAAPKTFGMAVRIYSGLRLAEKHPVVHNLVISNVPGPPVPIYFLGALVEGMYPLGPVFHGAGLNITVISSNGKLHVGIIACADLTPRLWDLAHHFPDELAALRKACAVQVDD